jgi:hypothetical protein
MPRGGGGRRGEEGTKEKEMEANLHCDAFKLPMHGIHDSGDTIGDTPY